MTPERKTVPNREVTLPAPTAAWAGAATEYSRDETIARLFELTAAEHADRTAVVCGGKAVTYRELNRKANRLAHRLPCPAFRRSRPGPTVRPV